MSRCAMPHDQALARIIARALGDARAAGLDVMRQRQRALQAVMAARPDLSAAAALTFVDRSVGNSGF
jgi:hypothetical protein